jgi:hypothetical protein
MKRALIFAALLTGCGGGDDEPSIEGFWFAEIDEVCGFGLDLTDGDYAATTGCELEDGGFGFEVELGSYVASADEITVTPTAASCFGGGRTYETDSFPVIFDSDSLSVVFPSGVIVFGRLPESDEQVTGVGSFGCWDDGLFTSGEIQPL